MYGKQIEKLQKQMNEIENHLQECILVCEKNLVYDKNNFRGSRDLLDMENNIQEILNYYLEYEIYNIASSAQIKVNDKTSMILSDIAKQRAVCESFHQLKVIKLREKIEKLVGKKVQNKEELVKSICEELDKLDSEQSNQVQIVFRMVCLIKEKLTYKIEEKVIEIFANELCDIKASQEFWLYAHNISFISKTVKKLPIFIFKCKMEEEKIKVVEANINVDTLSTVLSVVLRREHADIALEYEESLHQFSEEIKTILDAGDIEHLLELYYLKMSEFMDLSRNDIKQIVKINANYRLNEEFIMSLDELVEQGVKNIKEDIELLNKLILKDHYVPNLLNRYLNGSVDKKDMNEPKYEKMYRGNYKSSFGVGVNQYRIVNTIKHNDLIAIEGPPGTGKTSLLKEIIANKIVERADLIIKNWNQKLEPENYYGNTYYKMNWYKKDKTTVKSIVVSSKNGEAIENVGREINKEIKYMFPIARQYKRTETINNKKEKVLQHYKGTICLPLGKQDNIKDFKEFLYKRYIPMLDKLQAKKDSDEVIEKIKRKYEEKCKEIKDYEVFIQSLASIQEREKYFYGIEISSKKDIEKIEERFLSEKEKIGVHLQEIRIKRDKLIKQKEEQERALNVIQKKINHKERKIKSSKKRIVDGKNKIRTIRMQEEHFYKISKNIVTKLLNFTEYRKNQNIDFENQINEIEISNQIEDKKILQYRKDRSDFEKQKDEINIAYELQKENNEKLERDCLNLEKNLQEIILIQKFNELNEKLTYWKYGNPIEMYGKSKLNELNQELFALALQLNEAYIAKNSKEIVENLKLFLSNDEIGYICQKFYDSTDIYNDEKKEGIQALWNTLFLCFPVITTTLDSFSKRCFPLIPEYIDLELIDEAGQILPHNLVSALYRAKKAVIVGDINQIEPICHPINRDFQQNQKKIGQKFDAIKIEGNSIQTLANRNTDILNHGDTIILNDHYRCEKNIIQFSNENVYANKLNKHIPDDFSKPFGNNMIGLDVRGRKDKNENINKVEIESCIETIKYIKEQNQQEPSIAIITPFKKQKAEIENRLKKEKLDHIKVGTVHAFQGQEKDYIIFSSVIDSTEKRWALNFIGGRCNMLNVAVTRAKKQFIYLGNLSVALKAENYLTKLAEYIKKNGLVYSLYDKENTSTCDYLDEKILKILQPELEFKNDKIGLYIKQNIKEGVITDAKKHYEFLKYAIQNAQKEIYIVSPWIGRNVINEEFFNHIGELKQKDGGIKVVFGYRNGNKNTSTASELANELERTHSLGYATQEEVEKIIEEMYEKIGKENLIYDPPTHAKILIIDHEYMTIGSHNWLSNAGKTNEQGRAKEATIITTSKYTIDYVIEEFFNQKV